MQKYIRHPAKYGLRMVTTEALEFQQNKNVARLPDTVISTFVKSALNHFSITAIAVDFQ